MGEAAKTSVNGEVNTAGMGLWYVSRRWPFSGLALRPTSLNEDSQSDTVHDMKHGCCSWVYTFSVSPSERNYCRTSNGSKDFGEEIQYEEVRLDKD